MTVTSRSLNAPCVLVPGVAPLTRVTASCTRALSRAPLSDISASLHAIVAAGKIAGVGTCMGVSVGLLSSERCLQSGMSYIITAFILV